MAAMPSTGEYAKVGGECQGRYTCAMASID